MYKNTITAITIAGLIALLQLGIIGGMLARGLHPLWTGSTAEFRTTPMDPRDLLRGQYVALNYEFSRVYLQHVEHDLFPGERLEYGDTVYVGLEKKKDRYKAMELRLKLPPKEERPAGRLYLKGMVKNSFMASNEDNWFPVRIKYGIERYYTDPSKALKLENVSRLAPVKIIAAVTDSGITRIREIKVEKK